MPEKDPKQPDTPAEGEPATPEGQAKAKKGGRAQPAPPPSRFDDFSFSRRFDAANRVVQIFLVIMLFCSLNFLAATHFERFDLTRNNQYTLSPQTREHIRLIDGDVTVYSFVPDYQARFEKIHGDLEAMLREYSYTARSESEHAIDYEFFDDRKPSGKARELVSKYSIDFPGSEDAIQVFPAALVVGPHDAKLLMVGDLYEFERSPTTNRLQPTLFRGEEALTLAIMEVTTEKRFKVYFVNNHQEHELSSTNPSEGLSALRDFLDRGLYAVEPLDLLKTPQIPDDADMVVLPGPKHNLRAYEVQKLRRYLTEDNGRVMLFLGPWRNQETERADAPLRELLAEWGIAVDDMVVADTREGAIVGDEVVVSDFAPHPATRYLAENGLRVHSQFYRPVRSVGAGEVDSRVTLTPLMRASEYSWGELSYREQKLGYDEGVDLPGPVTLAMLSERNAGTLNIPGGRLMVFGTPHILTNSHFPYNPGNQILVSRAFAWMLDRDEVLNLPPREPIQFSLSVTPEEINTLGLRMLGPPAALAVLGLLVFLVRRR